MIASVRGKILEKDLGSCIVENNGLGYEIFLPQRIIEKFPEQSEVFFYCFHRVKEDQNTLFGFESKSEKLFFEQLISVSGVGPKTALSLFEFPADHIYSAIEQEDVKFLTQANGLGKKTASRLILELKGKIVTQGDSVKMPENSSQVLQNCISALEGLGFEKKSIQSLFQKNAELVADFSEEECVKWALQNL
jgi:Holliday junction DNA helicase RuvA